MPVIILNARIENAKAIKGMGRKWAKAKRASMESVARFWGAEILPLHFQSGNQSKYQHEKRNAFYKSVVKRLEGEGDGKTIDLQLKGQSKRYLLASARVTATANRATVYMQGPAYFSNPKIGRVQKDIKDKKTGAARTITINITRQPNKPAELTRVNDQDRRKIQRHLEGSLQRQVYLALQGV